MIQRWSGQEQMWVVALDECGVRYGICNKCRDARRENAYYDLCKKCTWTKSGKRRAEIDGAGFPSGQVTFCRPEDMERIDEATAASNTPSDDTPEGPDNLPTIPPAVSPHDPIENADIREMEQNECLGCGKKLSKLIDGNPADGPKLCDECIRRGQGEDPTKCLGCGEEYSKLNEETQMCDECTREIENELLCEEQNEDPTITATAETRKDCDAEYLEDSSGSEDGGLSDSQINDLPSEVLEEDLDDMCLICHKVFEKNNKIHILGCGHFFHKFCGIRKWLSRHQTCPVCRVNAVSGKNSALDRKPTGNARSRSNGSELSMPCKNCPLGKLAEIAQAAERYIIKRMFLSFVEFPENESAEAENARELAEAEKVFLAAKKNLDDAIEEDKTTCSQCGSDGWSDRADTSARYRNPEESKNL